MGWMDFLGERLAGAVVLDLFAGSGALGLEALSRGAVHADFVENGPAALHALKANVAAFRLAGPHRGWRPGAPRRPGKKPTVRVFKRDAIPFSEALERGTYDVAFADAPYGSGKLDRVVAAWQVSHFSKLLGVEHAPDHELPDGGRTFTFDETAVTIYGLPGKRRSRGRRRRGARSE